MESFSVKLLLFQQQIGLIEVPFRGRQLKVAGDRTFDTWTVTIINDTDMSLRGAFERWVNMLGTADSGQGRTNPSTYQKELYVYQLGRALPSVLPSGAVVLKIQISTQH